MKLFKRKTFGSGMNTLIICNEKVNYIIKIVKSLGDAGLLIKGVSKTIQNEVKEQKGGFFCKSLGTLGPSLLGNLLKSIGVKWSKIPGRGVI